ncbi:hypothetical protein AB0A60_14045 [Streptomyces sp. NPDC046275]|uniref:hypothetical protein n=1 Tax=Streptomyces sp. NPDC046275 TaxID=3157201 RepID=UPI0033FFCDDA
MSVLVTDTTGVSYAEIRAGELNRLRPVPGDMRRGVGTNRRAVRHRRGLTVLTAVPETNVPVVNGAADASALSPAPKVPRDKGDADVAGVTAEGTVLALGSRSANRPSPALHALPWGADAWQDIEVPADFRLSFVAGSAGDTAYVTGGVGGASADPNAEERPALFAVDTARGTVTELPLPDGGPARRRRDRWRLSSIDPTVGRLEDGAFHDDVIVACASYGEAFEHEVLHAADRGRGAWSTLQLQVGEGALAQYVDGDRTGYAFTGFGNLWVSRAGGPWERTALRKRLTELLGASAREFRAGPAALVGGRLLLAADGAVVACAPDGGDPRVLCSYDEGTEIRCFVEPPAGGVGEA